MSHYICVHKPLKLQIFWGDHNVHNDHDYKVIEECKHSDLIQIKWLKKVTTITYYIQLATYRNCQLFINLNFKSLHFLAVLNIASPPTFFSTKVYLAAIVTWGHSRAHACQARWLVRSRKVRKSTLYSLCWRVHL